jgi:hypothetical protein
MSNIEKVKSPGPIGNFEQECSLQDLNSIFIILPISTPDSLMNITMEHRRNRVIFFDLDGTLFDHNQLTRLAMSAM